MANPNDLFALDDLQMVTRCPIIAAMADEEHLRAAIDRVYQVSTLETTLDAAVERLRDAAGHGGLQQPRRRRGARSSGSSTRCSEQAIADRASDLHIEPLDATSRSACASTACCTTSRRCRSSVLRPMVSRLKILGGLDIAQNRVRAGRALLAEDRAAVRSTCASSTVPDRRGRGGRAAPARPGPRRPRPREPRAHRRRERARFLPAFHAPQGAVFITGPTGSGKTSTLYAVLSAVNTRDKSIVSVEDPVEYRLDGIKQIQINPRAGVTFPTALRSILRADPDVVLHR